MWRVNLSSHVHDFQIWVSELEMINTYLAIAVEESLWIFFFNMIKNWNKNNMDAECKVYTITDWVQMIVHTA